MLVRGSMMVDGCDEDESPPREKKGWGRWSSLGSPDPGRHRELFDVKCEMKTRKASGMIQL